MVPNTLFIGIGEYTVTKAPEVLKTILGSCVGVFIYDPVNRMGGLAHVYLPSAKEYNKKITHFSETNKYDYADILIPHMISTLVKRKSSRASWTAYLMGGSCMMAGVPGSSLDIGNKNLIVSKEILTQEGIQIKEVSVRGAYGRTVICHLDSGQIQVKKHI